MPQALTAPVASAENRAGQISQGEIVPVPGRYYHFTTFAQLNAKPVDGVIDLTKPFIREFRPKPTARTMVVRVAMVAGIDQDIEKIGQKPW